jgi:peptidoglycan/LPS O-acetylase OafA/YrhL
VEHHRRVPLSSASYKKVSPAALGSRIPSLDGIRAVSFLIVFVDHADLPFGQNYGGVGVTVFFFLSGYLITTLMRVEWARFNHLSSKLFYLRRMLRILPLFYIVLGLASAATVLQLLPGQLSSHAVIAQALHVTNYWLLTHGSRGIARGTGVYWSLAIEEHFYLLFPLVFVSLQRLAPARQAAVLYAACAVVLLWRCLAHYALGLEPGWTYLATDGRLDSILFGAALALYGNPALDEISFLRERHVPWVVVAAVCALILTERVPLLAQTVQGIALLPVFIAAVRYPGRWPFRLLNTQPMRFLGVLSYSLYLVHHVALHLVEAHLRLGHPMRALVGMALSLAVAGTLYQLVEKPCAALRQRLSRVPHG